MSNSRLSFGSANRDSGSIKNFSHHSNIEAKLPQESDNISDGGKSHKSSRSHRSVYSNMSRRSVKKRKKEFQSIPLKRSVSKEDPDDPILKKLE